MRSNARVVGRVVVPAVTAGMVAALAVGTTDLFTATAQQQPTFRVEANYVRVDVYVTADGVPVGDLTRDDFELFEDGAPQEIAAFEHVEVRSAAPTAAAGREPQTVADSRELARDPRSRST